MTRFISLIVIVLWPLPVAHLSLRAQTNLEDVVAGVTELAKRDGPYSVELVQNWGVVDGKPNIIRQLFKQRGDLKLYIQTRPTGQEVVRAQNDNYGFEVRGNSENPETWMLSGFAGGESRAKFIDGWDGFAKPVMRPDCFVERYPLHTMLASTDFNVEVEAISDGVELRIVPAARISSGGDPLPGPKSAEVVLSPEKGWVITRYVSETASGQNIELDVTKWQEEEGYFFPQEVAFSVDGSAATLSYIASFAPPPRSTFTLSAYGLPEPDVHRSIWQQPFIYLLAAAIALFIAASVIKKARGRA